METEFPHLDRAPIREALLDIKVEPRPEFAAENMAPFLEAVRPDFPDANPIRTMQTEFDLRGPEPTARAGAPLQVGIICWNPSKTRAVQARVDGFTLNHVSNYESWPVLRAQARELWSKYLRVGAPVRVVRCALRYINRLELPVKVDMAETLLTRPEVGARLPQLVDEYFMRLVVPFSEVRKAAITQASEPPDPGVPTRGLILDIDVSSTSTFGIGDDSMWQEFDELRRIKNSCFFESLKPSTWEKYR